MSRVQRPAGPAQWVRPPIKSMMVGVDILDWEVRTMAVRYCGNCQQNVEAKRKIGIGSLLLVVITAGFWLLLIPFYQKRCPKCQGTDSLRKLDNKSNEATSSAAIKKCPYCAEEILLEAIKCKHCGSDIG